MRRLLVAALAAASLVPGTAYAGGDEPATGGRPNTPPGPWSTDTGRAGPYRAPGTRRCTGVSKLSTPAVRILGVFVRGERCRRAGRLVAAYDATVTCSHGRKRIDHSHSDD